MSKKVISILLSAAMLVAMLCVGVGAVTASADDTATYYFLAPDEYFATNNSVGYYFWGSAEESAAWPGAEMTPAPEIGENVYKCDAPADAINIIFNAFVDAGTPADPELAANAHQTKDINLEGYYAGENAIYDELGIETENFYGMIFVLDNNDKAINDYSGAATTGGAWFSVDPSAPNYYKNFEQYYGSYNFSEEPSTDNESATTDLHAGDKVTIDITMKDVAYLGSIVAEVGFNPDLLDHEIGDYTLAPIMASAVVNDEQNESEDMVGKFRISIAYQAKGEKEYFAGDAKSVVSFNCTVKENCNYEDLQLEYYTEEIMCVNDKTNDNYDASQGLYIFVFTNHDHDADKAATDPYAAMKVTIDCDHQVATDSDTDTATDSEKDTDTATDSEKDTDTATDSEKDTDTATDSEAPVVSDTDTTSAKDSDKDSDKSSDSDKKATNDTASSTSSKTASSSSTKTTTTTTTSTVQTAGTFAVVSLVVILMAAAAVVLYTRKKTEE